MILKALIACVCAHFAAGQGSIPGVKDSCFQDPEPGICKAYLPSFYYNKAAKYCDCFVYTGCSGNENRYETLDKCRLACNVVSNQQIITKTCRNLLRGTNMLAELLNRTEFQGIDNLKPPNMGVATSGVSADADCSLPHEMGPCRAYLPSFFHDPQNKLCDCFVYSGCGGNVNRFRTLNDCRVTCDVGIDKQVITKSCKNILQGTGQWAVYLEQLNGPPVQDSTIDKIDIRKKPTPSTGNSNDSANKGPTSSSGTREETPVRPSISGSDDDSSIRPSSSGSDYDPSLRPSSSGSDNDPSFGPSSSGSDKDSSFRPPSSGLDKDSSFRPPSSGLDKDSSFRPSSSDVNPQSRPIPSDVSPLTPQFIPGSVVPIRPRLSSPPLAAVTYVVHRIQELKGSDDSRRDRE